MKWVLYILIIAGVVLINQTIFRLTDFGSFVPDLLLLFCLVIVWSLNNFDFLIFGIFGGIWLEVFLGLPIGSISLGLILVGSLAYLAINRWVFSEKPWQYFLGAVFLGTLFTRIWLWLFSTFLFNMKFSDLVVGIDYIWKGFLPALLVNLLLIYPVFIVVEIFAKYLQSFARNKLQL